MKRGFTLVETLVGAFLFLTISLAAYQGFLRINEGIKVLRIQTAAANLANEQFEIMRNLPYSDVGVVNGIPSGNIPAEQELVRDNFTFDVVTIIRNIDDPFDGEIGGDPNDLSPADYKLAEVSVTCQSCADETTLVYTARIAPLALETTGNNGALFVQVLDANGLPLQGAQVHIENNDESPAISIDEVTGTNGMFQLVDAPPGTETYEISVTQDGYSTDRTYEIGEPSNPVPDKPHANVSAGQVTQISFSIDQLSDLEITSRYNNCSVAGNVDFQLTGSKTIGLDTFKYDIDHVTNSSGTVDVNDLEWDTYTISITDPLYDFAGSNPPTAFILNPNSSQSIDIIVADKDEDALLVKVIDQGTGLPLSDATVRLENATDSWEKITGRGFLEQTSWAGGAGQEDFTNTTRYFSDDGNIDAGTVSGQISLVEFAGSYVSSGVLESSTFDTGTTTNFHQLLWNPTSQPAGSGSESVRFQVASNVENTATTTWTYLGPDGTGSSYFTSSGQPLHSSHSGDRYFRYKVLLSTEASTTTPAISDVAFTFSSDCTPTGQVLFSALSPDQYTIEVERNGYTTYVKNDLVLTEDWQEFAVILSP